MRIPPRVLPAAGLLLLAAATGCDFLEGARRSADAVAVNGFETGFRSTCEAECARTGGPAAMCATSCACTLQRLYGSRDKATVVRDVTSRTHDGQMEPGLRAEIEGHALECASDGYDETFVSSCAGAGEPSVPLEARTTHCRCMLTSLRGSMGRGEGTKWMMENLDGQQPTPAGTAAIDRAVAACATP